MTTYLDKTTFLSAYLACPGSPPEFPVPLPQPVIDRTGYTTSLLERILQDLITDKKYEEGAWVGLPKENGPGVKKESDMYDVLTKILEKIASLTESYYPRIERISGKWFDTSNKSLRSWSKHAVSDLKPDFVFAPKKAAEVYWSRTFSVIEVKKEPVADSGVDAQLNTYVSNIFREQIDRLFVNAVTLRGWEMCVHRFDRSGVVCMEKINIHKCPKDFIQVIASFSYLSPVDLGWDPTCKVWDSVTETSLPSYKLSQGTFRGCDVYDIPWVFQVDDESFVAIKAINPSRRLSIWGRGSFVAHVVTLADWQNRNTEAKVYVLKQCWQRLPGLGSEPITAELQNTDDITTDQPNRGELIKQFQDIDTKPFEATVMERAGWANRLRKSWMVQLDGKPITTFDTIRKNHATHTQYSTRRKTLRDQFTNTQSRSRSTIRSPTSIRTGTPATSGKGSTMQNAPDHPALVTRTLVRLVFDRPGWPIERFRSKKELLQSLKSIVQELGGLYEKGIVHRDVSPSNLLISDSGGHIIDFDHSKIAFQKGSVKTIERMDDKGVFAIATELLKGDETLARIYAIHLEKLWRIENRTATPADFNWPEQIGFMYEFGSRERRDGFLTGTYQYMSHHLEFSPFHHGIHDLDSLFWSVNTLPLKYEGPGGKKRSSPPVKIINKYYFAGTENKKNLVYAFAGSTGVTELHEMMSGYTDYFKDLMAFMKRWFYFLFIAFQYRGFEYHHPHPFLIKIIDEAIKELANNAEEGYADDVKEEEGRRQTEKEELENAISNRMTVGALLSPETVSVPSTASPATPVSATPNTPPRAPIPLTIQIPTAHSPETGRVVKRSRAASPVPEE